MGSSAELREALAASGRNSRVQRGAAALAPWAALLGLWTMPPLLAVLALMVRLDDGAAPPISWGKLFFGQLTLWYPWILLTPLVARVTRRHPVRGGRWWRHFMLHGVLALGVGLAFTTWVIASEMVSGLDLSSVPVEAVLATLLSVGGAHAVVYCLLVVGLHGLDFYRRAKNREVQLTRARLQALKTQVQPHFLFNALHAASTLMEEDVDGARRMIARLSELLRASLAAHAADQVLLEEELRIVDLYLDIESVRFADRLHIERHIDPDARGALVPHLALQPLVENAVRHGLDRRSGAGRIGIEAHVHGDRLEVLVSDNGPGLPGDDPAKEGIGLSNVRQRLAGLYAQSARLVLENGADGGCVARLELPLQYSVAPQS